MYVLLNRIKFLSPCTSNETQSSYSSLTNQSCWQYVNCSGKAHKPPRRRGFQGNTWDKCLILLNHNCVVHTQQQHSISLLSLKLAQRIETKITKP